MRSMSSTMKKKIASRIQTGENSMSASLWVGRPTTPLTDDNFLEKQTVLYSDNITKTSLAVCHPALSRGATHIYFAYIESGELKITRTHYVDIMERHEWEPVEFSEWAEDVALCFDGTMPKAPNGWIEFKTEQVPWVFWVLNGGLYGRKLDDPGEPVVLAEANCSAVSAVRAMGSSYGSFEFGLVVFFLLNGQLYYRQLIKGEWMDAEVVSFGPDGVRWEALAAFRTWDYRVGVQLKSTDGAFYELFTQYMGIGQRSTEHIELKAAAQGGLVEIKHHDKTQVEHLELTAAANGALIYGLSSMPISAINVDNGEGDFGFVVTVTMDYPVTNMEGNAGAFVLRDGNGVTFSVLEISISEDGKILTLTTVDFNSAQGDVTVAYSPGTVQSPAVPMEAWEFAFTPEGLVAPTAEPPVPVEAWNIDPEGTKVAVRFTEALVAGTSSTEGWSVSIRAYNYVPGGTVQMEERTITELTGYAKVGESLDLESAALTNTQVSSGSITLEVAE